MGTISLLSQFTTEQLLDELCSRDGITAGQVLDRFSTWQLFDQLDIREGVESVAIEAGGRMVIEVTGPALVAFLDQRIDYDDDVPGGFVDVLEEEYDGELEDDDTPAPEQIPVERGPEIPWRILREEHADKPDT